jgi:Ca2+-binding EF-hand superfamily protein
MNTTTYPNLSNHSINTTTEFFTQLDIDNTGHISVQQILDALQSKNTPGITHIPLWLQTFISDNQLDETSQVTMEAYNNYKSQLTNFHIDFQRIDIDNNGIININDLYNVYSEYFPPQINHSFEWFQNIVENENLNPDTSLSLEQLLTYENTYNTTHSWF